MKKPILVTGSHRSGSTWIGKIISTAKGVGYVREPFNLDIRRYNAPFSHQLEFISDACPAEYRAKTLRYIHSFVGFPNSIAWARIFRGRDIKDYYFTLGDLTSFRRRFMQRTLFKDPLATMSAEWFYNQFQADVVVVIRHPAAFVASLKVKDWRFDFRNLLDQKELMKRYLSAYESEIRAQVEHPADIIEQGILLWNIYYDTVSSFQKTYGDQWYFVRHEDLSLEPEKEYRKLFDFLHLEYSDHVHQAILASTTAQSESTHQRNALENIKSWKKRLSASEIETIRAKTERIWPLFYSPADWD